MLGLGLGNQYTNQVEGQTFHNTTTNTQSFNFDGGTTNYLERADAGSGDNWDFIDGSVSGTTNERHSYAFWLHRDSPNGQNSLISKYTTEYAYRHFNYNGTLMLDIYKPNGHHRRVQKTGLNSGSWEHYVLSYDGTNNTSWKIYINGVLMTGTTTGGTPSSSGEMDDTDSPFRIGYAQGVSGLNGQMCQFIAWKGVELDQSAVTYLYAGGSAHRDPTKPGTEGSGVYNNDQSSAVLAWLPMDDVNGADDHSGSTYGTHNFTKVGTVDVTTGAGNVPF